MSNFLTGSIGRKFLMSITGLFLILFLFIHLTINSFLILDGVFGFEEGQMFNAGAHFMSTFPIIKVMEPILALGFIFHIIYALILSYKNLQARGNNRYASGNKTKGVEWSSQNMLVLGVVIFAFLIVHVANFFIKIKFTGSPLLDHVEFPYIGTGMVEGENAYALVHEAFQHLWIVIVYVIGFIALAFHLSHGFWSGFQTIGWSNEIWLKRLKVIGSIIAWLISLGFTVIAVAQYLFF